MEARRRRVVSTLLEILLESVKMAKPRLAVMEVSTLLEILPFLDLRDFGAIQYKRSFNPS